MSFREKFVSLRRERKTILCVGIDPALPTQRKEKTIPSKYVDLENENESRLSFCLDIIDLVKDSTLAIKPNQQYIFGFTKNHHRALTDSIRRNGMLSILDYKLNDISDTAESGIFHISESGYDAVTFNPFAGNLSEVVHFAHYASQQRQGYELGIIVLTLMSNPEAVTFMKKAKIGQIPVFHFIASQVKECDADGCVIGATGHVTEEDIKMVRKTAGRDKVLLVPGIGTQRGDARKVLEAGGENVLVNVSRDIIYAENAKLKSEEYNKILRETART